MAGLLCILETQLDSSKKIHGRKRKREAPVSSSRLEKTNRNKKRGKEGASMIRSNVFSTRTLARTGEELGVKWGISKDG